MSLSATPWKTDMRLPGIVSAGLAMNDAIPSGLHVQVAMVRNSGE